MQEQQQQLVERLKQSQNILVTVSHNPSVDQLSAAIGLTLALNALGKHGTAVFSGQVPSTLEFLRPEDTLEKNTDSLRDFIIALDKSKADKLRYKVEDDVVRIFITPYKTSITDKDLDFSQGDFNVDVVIGLGVTAQAELDDAITAHGRILHDATVASISTEANSELGTINWFEASASSLSEMVTNLVDALDTKVVDTQIATALLTGIVASTNRFSNDRTTPRTMSVSAELMAAGANQQLIATQLEAPQVAQPVEKPSSETSTSGDEVAQNQPEPAEEAPKPEPGTLEIVHEHEAVEDQPESHITTNMSIDEPKQSARPQVQIDENGQFASDTNEPQLPEIGTVRGVSAQGSVTESEPVETANATHGRMTSEPVNGGQLTANSESDELNDPSTDELTLPPLDTPSVMEHVSSNFVPAPNVQVPTNNPTPTAFVPPTFSQPTVLPEPAASALPAFAVPERMTSNPDLSTPTMPSSNPLTSAPAIMPDETLTQIEEAVDSPHINAPSDTLDSARDAVQAAYNGGSPTMTPIEALNAQPLVDSIHAPQAAMPTPAMATSFGPEHINTGFSEPTPGNSPADQTLDMPLPPASFATPTGQTATPNPFPTAPSAFPGAPQQMTGAVPPPPVPPPMLPPLQ